MYMYSVIVSNLNNPFIIQPIKRFLSLPIRELLYRRQKTNVQIDTVMSSLRRAIRRFSGTKTCEKYKPASSSSSTAGATLEICKSDSCWISDLDGVLSSNTAILPHKKNERICRRQFLKVILPTVSRGLGKRYLRACDSQHGLSPYHSTSDTPKNETGPRPIYVFPRIIEPGLHPI